MNVNPVGVDSSSSRRFDDVAASAILIGLLMRVFMSSTIAGDWAESISLYFTFGGAALGWMGRVRRTSHRPEGRSALLLVAALGLGLIAARFDFEACSRVLSFSSFILGGVVLHGLHDDSRRRATTFMALISILVVLLVYGLAQRLWLLERLAAAATAAFGQIWSAGELAFMNSVRARATFGQANGFAGFLVFFLGLCVCALHNQATRRQGYILSVLLAAALLATGSKGGGLSALVIMGWIFRRLGLMRSGTVCFVVSGLLGAALIGAAGGIFGRRMAHQVTSLTQRFDYWTTALEIIKSAPWIGVGWDRFGEFASEFRTRHFSQFAHHSYLQIIAENGVFFLLPLAWCIRSLWQVTGRDSVPSVEDSVLPSIRRAFLLFVAAYALTVQLSPPGHLEMFIWDFEDPVIFVLGSAAFVLGCGWLGVYFIARKLWLVMDQTKTRSVILRSALIGCLVHNFVDYDIYLPGVSASLALWMSLSPQRPNTPIPANHQPWLPIGAAGLMIGVLALWPWRVRHQELAWRHFEEKKWSAAATLADREPVSRRLVISLVASSLRDGNPDNIALARGLLDRHDLRLGDLPSLRRLKATLGPRQGLR